METKIKYSTLNLRLLLYPGCILILWQLLEFILDENFEFSDLRKIILPVFFLTVYFYKKRNHYLTIKEDAIKLNYPFCKWVLVDDIIKIKDKHPRLTLYTESSKLSIQIYFVNENSIGKLKEFVEKVKDNNNI